MEISISHKVEIDRFGGKSVFVQPDRSVKHGPITQKKKVKRKFNFNWSLWVSVLVLGGNFERGNQLVGIIFRFR